MIEKFKNFQSEYQAILFDFDGVLVESANIKTEVFAKLFEPYGEKIVDKVVNHHIKYGGISRYKKIKYYYEKYLNMEITEKKLNEVANEFSDLVVSRVIKAPWVKGVEQVLEKYYQNIDLYVVSGTPQKELDLIIDKRKIKKYFKGVFGSPETKSEIAKRLIDEYNYDPKKVLYIGDSLSDYYDSKKAKVNFLGIVTLESKTNFPDNVNIVSDFLGF
jgi:HAD superfamily hydrolase (TIGR01549 family)